MRPPEPELLFLSPEPPFAVIGITVLPSAMLQSMEMEPPEPPPPFIIPFIPLALMVEPLRFIIMVWMLMTPPPADSLWLLMKNPPPLPGSLGLLRLPQGGSEAMRQQLRGELLPPNPPWLPPEPIQPSNSPSKSLQQPQPGPELEGQPNPVDEISQPSMLMIFENKPMMEQCNEVSERAMEQLEMMVAELGGEMEQLNELISGSRLKVLLSFESNSYGYVKFQSQLFLVVVQVHSVSMTLSLKIYDLYILMFPEEYNHSLEPVSVVKLRSIIIAVSTTTLPMASKKQLSMAIA